MISWRRVVVLASLVLAVACGARAETRWPRWRGPRGDGHSAEKNLPTTWNNDDVAWKTALPGAGESSPIIWLDRIFLTTAEDGGRSRSVLCVDRHDGQLLWKQTVNFSGPREGLHKMNTFASPTCVTDGEIVLAFFGRAGLHAWSLHGKPLWSKDVGIFEGPWGVAASPVLVGDLVIQNGDSDRDAFLEAFDKRTGKSVWRVPRLDHRGWSTPTLFETDGRQELILNGHEGVVAYDPATGKTLWSCRSFSGRGEPTATPGDKLIYMVNGLPGDVYAIRPGGTGDVTSSHITWHTPRKAGRDLPSPIVIGKHLVVVSLAGMAVCYDADDGHPLWQERLGGRFSASPIAAAGLAYFLSEDGGVVVLEPGPSLKQVARNQVTVDDDEVFRASPAPCEGQLFLRSDRALYCIGRRAEAAAN